MNVTTPKPRKAKNVRATLDTMSRTPGYVDGARFPGCMFAMVMIANPARIPITTTTTRLWTRATTLDPATLRPVMTMSSATANAFTAAGSPSANAELA